MDNSSQTKLLISLLLCYPISVVHSLFVVKTSKNTRLLYHLLCGLSLIIFNYGSDGVHFLIVCLFCYTTLHFLSIRTAVVLNFTVPMTYLVYGCYVTQIGYNYSLTWTIAQCVLTLRLIAITFDVYDGKRNLELRKKDEDSKLLNPKTAIETVPTLLEFLSHNYFPTTVLVGPLIPYRQFITNINSDVNHLPKCWPSVLSRLSLGVLYFAGHHFGSQYFSGDYLLSEHYQSLSFVSKIVMIGIVCRLAMLKYITCWLMSEGACIASGVTYNGQTYYSSSNVKVLKYELGLTSRDLISSFNLTTNGFALNYIYKRLKFLGNKNISQVLTLLFLSVWHGIDSGYLVTFAMEFFYIRTEMQMIAILNAMLSCSKTLTRIRDYRITRIIEFLIFKTILILIWGYSFVPMLLIKFNFWYPVLSSVYFYGHVITVILTLISYLPKDKPCSKLEDFISLLHKDDEGDNFEK